MKKTSQDKLFIEADDANQKPNNSAYSLNNCITISQLMENIKPITEAEMCLNVLDIFVEDKSLSIAPIINEYFIPIGLIDRGRLTEIFFKPFSRDLYYKKSIREIMTKDPIIVDINTTIDELWHITLKIGMKNMCNGLIVTTDNRYAGIVSGHKLLEEISHRKQQELYFLAHYDQLTGIPNRLLFKDRLLQACHQAKRGERPFALVFIDVDQFKQINDTFGHGFGDQLLVNIANRLTKTVRESDTIARLGGDEFVIILQNLGEIKHADIVAQAIINAIREPILIFERTINVTASLGVALFPMHDITIDGIMHKADCAMYASKENGRNGYTIYSKDTDTLELTERPSLETELELAVNNGQLQLLYQPQIQYETNQVIGIEALLRWHHPTLGLVSPAQFIPIAEESGLISPIGEWVLTEACQQHTRWINQGLPKLRVAVNISVVQFRQANFCDLLSTIIEKTGIDPNHLELELTENVVMTDPIESIAILNKLRAMGIKLAIDDFGTGNTSLVHLARFPIDRIKIDPSFIRNIQDIPGNATIVRAIMAMGDSLGLEMIAEGVETLAELECIQNNHCEKIQGYLCSVPIPPEKFKAWYDDYTNN
ncbi:MAG: EAL domain-containing protein [Methylovulum sp.]|nr:EAL domain-containing protein [Methylovulum sp.]